MRICLLVLLLLCAGCGRINRKLKKNLQMVKPKEFVVPTFAVNQSAVEKTQEQIIRGTRPDEMRAFISEFPLCDYQMLGVTSGYGVEYFCVDGARDFMKGNMLKGVSHEGHLVPYMFKYCKPGSTVIDIGAHIGTHCLHLSRAVGPTGKVYAFEPQPKSFRELLVNMTLNQVKNTEFFWTAIGDRVGTIELGPLNQDNEGGTGFGGQTGTFVDLISLDSLHLDNVSFIKIDVEGMEIEVLKGALETIARNKPVMLLEIMGGWDPERSPEEQKLEILSRIAFVESLGYELVRIPSWDYLCIPKGTPLHNEIVHSKVYAEHRDSLKKWAVF